MGQTALTTASTFEVVSIRPYKNSSVDSSWGATQTGYDATNVPLVQVILQAYFAPSGDDILSQQFPAPMDRLKNAPPWVMTEPYNIAAKVAPATADAMKDMKPLQWMALEAPMLRAMLQDRCKLVVHTMPIEVPGYALVVGKHGMKIKEAQPDEPEPPHVFKLAGNKWMVIPRQSGPDATPYIHYLQITMAELTAFLGKGATPLVDQTGLTGRYDFELPIIDTSSPGAENSSAPDLDVAHKYDWGALGLEMKPIKVPAVDLVIDHIERPTEN